MLPDVDLIMQDLFIKHILTRKPINWKIAIKKLNKIIIVARSRESSAVKNRIEKRTKISKLNFFYTLY